MLLVILSSPCKSEATLAVSCCSCSLILLLWSHATPVVSCYSCDNFACVGVVWGIGGVGLAPLGRIAQVDGRWKPGGGKPTLWRDFSILPRWLWRGGGKYGYEHGNNNVDAA